MKKRIFNPTNAVVDMIVLGVKVFIPAGEDVIVDKQIGNELQEIQPQLEYFDVSEKLMKAKENELSKKLSNEVKEKEALAKNSVKLEKDLKRANAKAEKAKEEKKEYDENAKKLAEENEQLKKDLKKAKKASNKPKAKKDVKK